MTIHHPFTLIGAFAAAELDRWAVEVTSKTEIATRLPIACAVGLVVFLLSAVVAWQNTRRFASRRQLTTRMELMVIEGEIKTRRSPPRSLDQLRTASEEPHQVHVDGWDRPFLYLVDGEDYSVLSYGRDGKPGGTGLDSDLASDDPWRSGTDATLAQFLIEMPTEGIIGACVVSGGIAFLVCLLTVKRTDFADGNALRTAVKLILTTIGALAASAVMSALHIPTGH